ncbi:putative inactive receptor kinase [Forsythia ovata]|uniref:non-specific serine/threonine protein kinase n=1 Tax=Forsythia ovata TaxID=205694 RepID=A0ABD1X9R5_9LAMI
MHLLMYPGKIGENPAHLDWGTRLRIAVGAARGIAHIHKQSGGKLVHGNIKSSNIFLNSQLYGCVSDLGMAKMIATPVMQTARYHAPEVKNTQNVSQASDVYSFGILLLELLTRKSPLHATSGDLVKLVNSVNGKEQTANVFDVELLRNRNIEEQMIKMLQIGMSCVARTPKKRLKMAEVVKMIEDISMMNTRNRLQQKLVFTEGLNPAFDYDDMMMASVEVLGKGTFGTSFRATLLENRISFVVKRLTDVNVTGEAFHQKMEVIGRMRHENVASLMAYYRSKHENLVLYDYHGQGSVSSMVHGKRGDNHTSLEWETRLRIAVGAARGIAHIHSQVGQTLVHGNVKSSNIFLNAQGYGCVSEGGLTTLMSQWALPVLRSAGYFAPELTDTKTVSQASDVYGFGVVLLELLTGKPAIRSAADGEAIQLVSWVNSVVRHEWTGEVFDIQLLKYPSMEDAMLKLLQIGMICTASDPWRRLKMSEVVKILEDISG